MNLKTIGLWALKIIVALAFLGAGAAKLSGQPMMVAEFGTIGLGDGFRYFTGAVEVIGALLILWPKTSFWGAALVTCVSIGAFIAQATVLHGDVIHTIVAIVLTGFLAWIQRGRAKLA